MDLLWVRGRGHGIAYISSQSECDSKRASAFVKFYEEYAIQKGCSVLRMDTNERNTIARKLYQARISDGNCAM